MSDRQYMVNALVALDMELGYRVEYVAEKKMVNVHVLDLARLPWESMGARHARRDME